MSDQRVITYIDGYNLYYGLLDAGLRSPAGPAVAPYGCDRDRRETPRPTGLVASHVATAAEIGVTFIGGR